MAHDGHQATTKPVMSIWFGDNRMMTMNLMDKISDGRSSSKNRRRQNIRCRQTLVNTLLVDKLFIYVVN